MINQESIRYSLRNLKNQKGRSFLTLFSILIGISTIFIFISFGYGLYSYTDSFTTGSSVDKVLIMAKGAGAVPSGDDPFALTDDDLKVVRRAGGVQEAVGTYFTVVEVKDQDKILYSYVASIDPKIPLLLDIFDIGYEKGRGLSQGDSKKVLLGYNYLIDGKIFDKGLDLNENIEINGENMKIIGFFESVGNPQDDSQLYITNDYFEELFPDISYAEIIARVELNRQEMKIDDKIIENIEKGLRNHRNQEEGQEDFYVQTFEDMIESFSSILNIVVGFVLLIALISVFVSAINTANTMITSVLERFKEIGVLKSIGARNQEIFGIFLFESAFLGFLAGIIGVLFGFGVTSLAGYILFEMGYGFLQPAYSIFFPYDTFLYLILFAVFTGAISGAIPSYQASKTNTVDALRYE